MQVELLRDDLARDPNRQPIPTPNPDPGPRGQGGVPFYPRGKWKKGAPTDAARAREIRAEEALTGGGPGGGTNRPRTKQGTMFTGTARATQCVCCVVLWNVVRGLSAAGV